MPIFSTIWYFPTCVNMEPKNRTTRLSSQRAALRSGAPGRSRGRRRWLRLARRESRGVHERASVAGGRAERRLPASRRRARDGGPGGDVSVRSRPVSYTHLTLPTIYSV